MDYKGISLELLEKLRKKYNKEHFQYMLKVEKMSFETFLIMKLNTLTS